MERVFTQTVASGMQDVAAIANVAAAAVAVCGSNGTVWRTTDGGGHFTQSQANGFRRVAASPDGSTLWGVGANGTLWYTTTGDGWTEFKVTSKLGRRVEDVVVDYDNSLWVTTENGQVWAIRDGQHWEWHSVLGRFKRLAVGPAHHFWGIDTDGNLWLRDPAQREDAWYATQGTGMEDVSVANDGLVWLVGSNGTLWTTYDGGQFTQVPAKADFVSVSAAAGDVVWLARKDGTVWRLAPPPPAPPPPAPPPPPPPPPPPKVDKLHVYLVDMAPAYYAVSTVTWSLYQADFAGVTAIWSAQGMSADVVPPSNGQYHLHSEVWVVNQTTGDTELAEFRGNNSVGGFPVLTFVWAVGVGQSKGFRLFAEPSGIGGLNAVVAM